METPGWIRELMQVSDARDVDGYLKFLTPDAVLRFGNAPEFKGQAAIREALSGFFQSIAGLEHTILHVWSEPGSYVLRGDVTYTRLDGSQLTIPYCTIFYMKGKLIERHLAYGDQSPLYKT